MTAKVRDARLLWLGFAFVTVAVLGVVLTIGSFIALAAVILLLLTVRAGLRKDTQPQE